MVTIFVLCALVAFPVVYPWLRRSLARGSFLWRTRSIRWKTWRNPKSTEPWTEAERDAVANALVRAIEESEEP